MNRRAESKLALAFKFSLIVLGLIVAFIGIGGLGSPTGAVVSSPVVGEGIAVVKILTGLLLAALMLYSKLGS